MVSAREVRDLLDERPDLEPAIETVLAADAPWTFHDVDVDSGRFGELVSRGIVEEIGEGYRVPDQRAVEAALHGEVRDSSERSTSVLDGVNVPSRELLLVAGALVFVIVVRSLTLPSVFRGELVVLSLNDPYYYRYWVEQLLSNPETTLETLPSGVTKGEPLMIAALWFVTRLLGGGSTTAGQVLALYPIASAVATGLFVYLLSAIITEDRRIGIAAVTLLAVMPGHAFRTSLGFADHHAFDYPWLLLTLLCLVVLADAAHRRRPVTDPRRPLAVVGIGLGVAGQILSWDNSPLLIAPILGYLLLEGLAAVGSDRSPAATGLPVVAGVGVAAAGTWIVHSSLGWHTTLVAAAPAIAFLVGVALVAVAETVHRLDGHVAVLAVLEAGVAIGSVLALRRLRPEYWSRLVTSLESRLLASREIVEVRGLFGSSLDWLLLFGFILVLAIPFLAWAAYRAREDARWVPAVAYALYFVVLAGIQVRFAGQLGPVIAVFAGLGFVHLANWVDVARPPAPFTDRGIPDVGVPDRGQLGALALLFLMVTSLSLVQVPVVMSQVSTPDGQVQAATVMMEYNESQNRSYPENYVFSEWGRNRMYNYFVNGESRSYGYAQSNYVSFVSATDGQAWYERLRGRAGFIVVKEDAAGRANQLGAILYERHGSRAAIIAGLAHYRLVHVTHADDYKVFTLVPGAVIAGNATANATVPVVTEPTVTNESFTYGRATTADASGSFAVRVAYPGTYDVGNETVTVPERAVQNGSTVRVPGRVSVDAASTNASG